MVVVRQEGQVQSDFLAGWFDCAQVAGSEQNSGGSPAGVGLVICEEKAPLSGNGKKLGEILCIFGFSELEFYTITGALFLSYTSDRPWISP